MVQPLSSESVTLALVQDPVTGRPKEYPIIPSEVYVARLDRLRNRLVKESCDAVVIYGDREHFANFAWLTGIEPRFEEAIAVVCKGETPTVLLGNECLSLAEWTAAPLRALHWPSLSLISQPRTGIQPLPDLLRKAGIRQGQKVGLAGWKYFGGAEFPDPSHAFETPHYLVEALRELAGDQDRVVNATSWLMSPEDGLRIENEPEQIAQLEFGAVLASEGVQRLLRQLQPGKTEMHLAECLKSQGVPLSCHPMVSTGEKARFGLTSPSSNQVKLGDAFMTALGVCGGLTCRAGYVAASVSDLPQRHSTWLESLARPFFAGVASWYQTIRVGLPGGELFGLMESLIPRAQFGWSLNPGHLLGMDEWISSPVYPGSSIPFRSGTAVQMDIIPAPPDGSCGGNVEDGIVLADEALRSQLASRFPDLWKRMAKRRRFMEAVLGIRLHESVLPLSNFPALWRPLLLNRNEALLVR